ncbi:MAG: DUF5658 family protein [Dehalococcoidales bacterium]|nr:DUF5658 family protein [Dehalococcoidales bacterium]
MTLSRLPDGISNLNRRLSRYFPACLALMVLLQVADCVLTLHMVSGGMVKEGNGLVRSLFLSNNYLLIKVAGAVVCGLALWALSRRFLKLAQITNYLIIALYGAVLLWNTGIVFSRVIL